VVCVPAGVGAGPRLGEPEAAQHLSGGEERHEALLLLLGAEVDDRRGAERGVRGDGDRVEASTFASSWITIV
jgi:hypothetical protein